MTWLLTGGKPLLGPMITHLLAHKCIARIRWVKEHISNTSWIFPHNTNDLSLDHFHGYLQLIWGVRRCVRFQTGTLCQRLWQTRTLLISLRRAILNTHQQWPQNWLPVRCLRNPLPFTTLLSAQRFEHCSYCLYILHRVEAEMNGPRRWRSGTNAPAGLFPAGVLMWREKS